MMTKQKEVKGMKRLAWAGMMFLMVLLLAAVPMKTEAAGMWGQATKAAVPKKKNGRACVSLNIKWKKENGADGYVIYRSTSRFGRYKAIKDIESDGVLAYNDSSVQEGRVYYYKVRAYQNKNEKKIFAKFASLKVDKVMKTVSTKKVSFWAKIKNYFS